MKTLKDIWIVVDYEEVDGTRQQKTSPHYPEFMKAIGWLEREGESFVKEITRNEPIPAPETEATVDQVVGVGTEKQKHD